MWQTFFGVFVFLPSLLLCFVILATFFRPANAYLAISWIPISLFFTVRFFSHLDAVTIVHGTDYSLLLDSISWTSLFQGMIGAALIIKAVVRKEAWIVPLFATILTISPNFFTA